MNRKITQTMIAIMALAGLSCHGELTPPEDVKFKARNDGTEQFYMKMRPVRFDANKKYDLIIGLHGHGSGRAQFATDPRPECRAFREFASKHDMIAVTPDYRAATSWMGPKAEADVVQIITALKTKYRIHRVFMIGASMGGTAVLTFAALHPDLVDGVTSMNGLANHLEYARFQDAIAASFGGPKDKIPAEYKKRSAEFWPEKLTMPIAFTIGGNDGIVPPASVLRLAETLKKASRKVLVINQPAGGHATSFADAMAAMEFMLTGVVPESPPVSAITETKPPEVAVTNVVVRSDKGGIFFGDSQPATGDAKGRVEVGLKFYVETTGRIKSFFYYQAKSEVGAHIFHLWSSDGKPLLVVNAPEASGMGWVEVPLPDPFPVTASTEYIVSYTCNKNYVATPKVLVEPVRRAGIMAVAGLYSFSDLGQKAPDKTNNGMNYFLDVMYEQ